MIACLKGKAHEWRLVSDKVVCRLCNARGTLQDLNGEIGSFYALRDERDELQATLDELRASYCMEITRSSNLEAEWDEALRRVVQLGAQAVKLRDERDSIASERDELQADLNAQKAIACGVR